MTRSTTAFAGNAKLGRRFIPASVRPFAKRSKVLTPVWFIVTRELPTWIPAGAHEMPRICICAPTGLPVEMEAGRETFPAEGVTENTFVNSAVKAFTFFAILSTLGLSVLPLLTFVSVRIKRFGPSFPTSGTRLYVTTSYSVVLKVLSFILGISMETEFAFD